MRKRTIFLLSTISLSLALNCCSNLSNADGEVTVKSIRLITDGCNDFAVGDQYFDRCENTGVVATYSNNKKRLLQRDEFEYVLTSNHGFHNIDQPFEYSGYYSLVGKYRGLFTSVYNFNVGLKHKYTQTLGIAGPYAMAKGETVRITLETDLDNFGGEVLMECGNSSLFTINKINSTTYDFTGVAVGTSSLKFTAHKDESNVITASRNLLVQNISKTDIKQTIENLDKNRHSLYPTSGSVRMLVVPIWFTDSENYISSHRKTTVWNHINQAFFGDIDKETGLYSVSKFYETESEGALKISGVTTEWYNCGKSTTDFLNDHSLVRKTIKAAVEKYFEDKSLTFRKLFDSDSDGYLDCVNFVYGAADYKAYDYGVDDADAVFWCYESYVDDTSLQNVDKPGPGPFTWSTYDSMYSKADGSELVIEYTGHNYTDARSKHMPSPQTFIHEVGHVFGLPDLYDIGGDMGFTGNLNMQTDDHCGHDPYSVMELGWADPFIPTNSCTIVLNDFQSTHELILLTPEWNSYDSCFDEYILLELFTPTRLNYLYTHEEYDFDTYPFEPGIRVWHINAKLIDEYDDVFTSNANNLYAYLAFNNSTIRGSEGGRDCNAVYLNENFQKYSYVHVIANGNRFYHKTSSITPNTLFHAGDTFSMNERIFKRQFVKYYLKWEELLAPYHTEEYWDDHAEEYIIPDEILEDIFNQLDVYNTLDFGQQLGWEFKVNSITHNGGDSYSASIELTKTA